MGAGASQCAMLSVCVREVYKLPGRKRGSSDGVRRKRRGKTLDEMEKTVAKKAKRKDTARIAK